MLNEYLLLLLFNILGRFVFVARFCIISYFLCMWLYKHMLMTSRQQIGSQLKTERKVRGLSQADIAVAIDTDRAVISKIENGKYTGSLKVFERYLTHLGFQLLIGKVKPQRPQFDELEALFPDE